MSSSRLTEAEPRSRLDLGLTSRADEMRPYDVRLRREITHRRLAISLVRRAVRVVTLHALDGAVIVALVALLAHLWPEAAPARPFMLSIAAIVLISLDALAAYSPGDARRDRSRLFAGMALATGILLVLATFPPALPLSPTFLAILAICGFTALALGRKAADLLVRQAYVHGIGLRRAVIVGTLDETGRAIQHIRDERNIDQYIVGHLSPEGTSDPTALGEASSLALVLDRLDVQEVVVAGALPEGALQQIAHTCFERGTALFMLPPLPGTTGCSAEPCRVGPATLLRVHPSQLQMPTLLVKRSLDLLLALVALVLLVPVIGLIALLIRIDSAGPVFFRQQRVGLGGRIFTIWKFRCMSADAEARKQELAHLNIYGDPRLFKLTDDPRVTRVGRVLRRTSLDEVPQLFNVLLGDMSLVGPRPPVPSEVASYEPHHFERLSVVPGITGPWQVGGRNLITDFEEVVRMERAYIHSWSLWADVKILLRTMRVVVSGEGAY